MTSTLRDLVRPSSFLKLVPDPRLANGEAARANVDNLAHTPRTVAKGHYSCTIPEERKRYVYLLSQPNALRDLGLTALEVALSEYRALVSGQAYHQPSQLPPSYAQAYAGWQFGQFAGQLGDGRVVNLFDVPKPKHLREEKLRQRDVYEVQLKGAGMTPYLRFADGKAVLRSSIREYIISEHLAAIGIPTTRALSITYLPETYAQRHTAEKCAIVSRFAELWVRLGSFDLMRYRGDREGCKELAEYVINVLLENKFDQFDMARATGAVEIPKNLSRFDKMYYELIARNALTAALWQVYGFLNGVLNTDNTLVVGLLMDFGPFLIMDKFNPNYTPNSEDHDLRYSYKSSPTAIWWNLTRFGEDLAELLGAGPEHCDNEEWLAKDHEDEVVARATNIIEVGGEIYQWSFTKAYVEGFFDRLGLSHKLIDYKNISQHFEEFVAPMLLMLFHLQCDFNKFFLQLAEQYPIKNVEDTANFLIDQVEEQLSTVEHQSLKNKVTEWLEQYQRLIERTNSEDAGFINRLDQSNPLFLPRGWILDEVIAQTELSDGKDLLYLVKLQQMSLNPFDPSKWGDDLKEVERNWMLQGDKVGQSMLQCLCLS